MGRKHLLHIGTVIGLAAINLTSCKAPDPPDAGATPESPLTAPGVSQALAIHRAATLSELHYDLELSIPAARSEAIRGRITTTLELEASDAPLIFDFAQSPDHIQSVTAAGQPVTYEARNEHIVISASELQPGSNEITIEFIAGDSSLNRNEDFLYTLFVPDRARVALPVFDQPDLKARFDLQLEIPGDWTAIANGELASLDDSGPRHRYRFATTEPLPTYL
ncbi:MAG: aminopeptidase, partial [Acidobacteriota bacterium]